MSSNDEELPNHTESEAPAIPDSECDAHVGDDGLHVGDDVCVAVISAARSSRRRWWDASWVTAVTISLLCHLSLGAAWWEWHVRYEMPDFGIRSGAGGTVGLGTSDDKSAAPPAASQMPAVAVSDPLPMSNAELAAPEDEPLSPSLVNRPSDSPLVDSMNRRDDLIGMRPSGWSPEVVPSRGSAKGTTSHQDAPPGESTRIAPQDPGSGGGGDGLAVVNGLSGCAANDPPKYPLVAYRERQQGTVWLNLTVSADGHIRDITVKHSSGFPLLDAEAVRAYSTYVVAPYRENGVAMDFYINQPVVFTLRDAR